jgi:signal transduction histidine kinase
MNKEQVAKLSSFRRNESTVGSAGEGGTGLGLPFCFQIAWLHGSNLDVLSTPGEGTQFMLRLPKQL